MLSQNKQNCELRKKNQKKKHDTKSGIIKLQFLQETREHKPKNIKMFPQIF